MARRPLHERNVRKIQLSSNGSYIITLPIEAVANLSWRKGQKVVVEQVGSTITIKDWKKN